MSTEAVSETNGFENGDGSDGFRRKNSLERYRPGAYFNEEREKLRRRAHFGERRLADSKESNGSRGGNHGQRRNNRSRGRGGRQGGQEGQEGRPEDQFNTYRNPNNDNNGVDYHEAEQEVTAAPPPILNWADEEVESSPEATPKKADPEEKDLRNKLNSMRLNGGGQQLHNNHHQEQHHRDHRGNGEHRGNGDHRGNGEYRGNANHRGNGDHRGNADHHGRHYQDRGQGQWQNQGQQHKNQRVQLVKSKRNTENFNPSHEPAQMRILAAPPGLKIYNRPYLSRDVVMVNDLFGDPNDLTIYHKLLDEMENSGVDVQRLWQLWHGDSHLIADDKKAWKDKCPTFHNVVETMSNYFNMDVKATRFNWYRDSSEWKPFHHDAAAIKEKYARTQNFTVGVSFGAERDAAFEHAQTKTIISMPQPNGSIYTFAKDVNCLWRHGIPQLPPDKQSNQGRISIIAWGWIEMEDV